MQNYSNGIDGLFNDFKLEMNDADLANMSASASPSPLDSRGGNNSPTNEASHQPTPIKYIHSGHNAESQRFNLRLIRLVKDRPELYDLNCAAYKSSVERDRSWKEIAAILNHQAEFVRTRWKTMRDRYKKEYRKYESKLPVQWAHFYEMNFLRPFFRVKNFSEEVISMDRSGIDEPLDDSLDDADNSTKFIMNLARNAVNNNGNDDCSYEHDNDDGIPTDNTESNRNIKKVNKSATVTISSNNCDNKNNDNNGENDNNANDDEGEEFELDADFGISSKSAADMKDVKHDSPPTASALVRTTFQRPFKFSEFADANSFNINATHSTGNSANANRKRPYNNDHVTYADDGLTTMQLSAGGWSNNSGGSVRMERHNYRSQPNAYNNSPSTSAGTSNRFCSNRTLPKRSRILLTEDSANTVSRSPNNNSAGNCKSNMVADSNNEADDDEEDELFCRIMLKKLKKMSEHTKESAKAKILELLVQIQYGDMP